MNGVERGHLLAHPELRAAHRLAHRNVVRSQSKLGSALGNYHKFCDAVGLPERARAPASFDTLRGFVLWATLVPPSDDARFRLNYEPPVAVDTALEYAFALRDWHARLNVPWALSPAEEAALQREAKGVRNLQAGEFKKPPRPPFTVSHLLKVRGRASLDTPSGAAAFFGLLRCGEATVHSESEYSPATHISARAVKMDKTNAGRWFARLRLPRAKTAALGEFQDVVVPEESAALCPLRAWLRHRRHNQPGLDDHAFSWRDGLGEARLLLRDDLLRWLSSLLLENGEAAGCGHSLRIRGACFLYASGVEIERIRLQGRWRSLAYEVYLRGHEVAAPTALRMLA